MADLKTNYVDDVLDTSVNEKRKYNMIQNADGTVSFNDVTTYMQNGDTYGSNDVNETNEAVNALNNSLNTTNSNMKKIKTYVGTDGKLHFVDATGADSVLPFNNVKTQSKNTAAYDLSSNQQISISLTFENLSKVLGVQSISSSNYWVNVGSTGSALSISGNTVTFTARNQLSNGNSSFYANLVAVGY